MSSHAERKNLSKAIWKDIIPFCCNGNKDAETYLKQMFYIIRLVDDFYDEDYPVDKNEVVRGFFYLLAEIPANPFYKTHSDSLVGVHIIAFNAWQDSNEWRNSEDKLKTVYSHVLRDYVCELFILVAFLTGGEASMKKISLKVRETFLKEL